MPVKEIGVELEGVFRRAPFNDGSFEKYGSIGSDSTIDDINYDSRTYFEAEVRPRVKDLATLKLIFDKYYPSMTNHTCGMHVHVSFSNSGEYMKFMSRRFYAYFRQRIQAWAKNNLKDDDLFWDRFNGKNSYCCKFFIPEKQIGDRHHDFQAVDKIQGSRDVRYAALNFCWRRHRTLECRLFPCWSDKNISFSAITELVDIYNSWLQKCPNRPLVKNFKIDSNEPIQEIRRVITCAL